MVRSMPPRGGRPLAPTAPTRRQRDAITLRDRDLEGATAESSSTPRSSRSIALERRLALTTAGKSAALLQGATSAGRVRSSQDNRRSTPQQPGWVRREKAGTSGSVPYNLSRSSLPITHRQHPLTDTAANARLRAYEQEVKGRFDRIVPLLQRVSALQHEPDFIEQSQRLTRAELGFDLPQHILERAWVRPLDMRALFAWCVFESHRLFSDRFFQDDPLDGAAGSAAARDFEQFLLDCGIHLLDVSPCADGRLAHTRARHHAVWDDAQCNADARVLRECERVAERAGSGRELTGRFAKN